MANLKYRLALDLGSTSLGWAVFRLSSDGQPTAIIRSGVRIFNNGRDAKTDASLAVTRRAARAMRRRRDRLLRRKNRMLEKLMQYGFLPKDMQARKALETLNPYALRARGVHEALKPHEFGRALFHINQRRGFKSNRKTDKGASDAGIMKSAIGSFARAIQDAGCQTVGELLYKRMTDTSVPPCQRTVRARYREHRVEKADGKSKIEKSYDLYIDRAMIAHEFDVLWAKQAELNPVLFNEAARYDLRDTLLYQRDLRPVRPGRCTLCPKEPRAPLALPSQQRFRIYQEVHNLCILDSDLRETAITVEQRDKIVQQLETKKTFTFKAIRKLLGLDSNTQFNLEDVKRKELKGNITSATLSRKEHFGKAWFEFDDSLQDEIVQELLEQESEDKLIHWLQDKTHINVETAARIAEAGLLEGYGRLSAKALNRILPALREPDMTTGKPILRTYDKAVQAAGFAHHSDLGFDFAYDLDEVERLDDRIIKSTGEIKPVYVFKQLPYYGRALQRHVAFAHESPKNDEQCYGKIANPTVHIGLNQVRVVVNELIREYGRPAEVVVELARDLKQSKAQKQEAQKRQADNQKRNTRIRDEIAKMQGIAVHSVKRSDIQKWILWEELSFDIADRRCPYSGASISANMLLSAQVEIEHILPFSETLDDSLNNKTVSLREANRIKGNRTPWDAQLDFKAKGWLYEDIVLRAERIPQVKSYRFAEDGLARWKRDDSGFLARALNDTRYLSRVTKEYLTLICPSNKVRTIPGNMTALLRSKLGLNSILGLVGEKNRNDHRHHAVDACVIGITDQALLQRFAQASAEARQKGLERLVEKMPEPWETYREHVRRAVCNIWVSHKPEHGHEGAMHNDTAYGLLKEGRVFVHKIIDGKRQRVEKKLQVIPFANQKAIHATNKHWFGSAHHKPAEHYKGYKGDSNYCIEIVRNEKGKWQGEIVSTFEAYQLELKLQAQYKKKHGKKAVVPSLTRLLSRTHSVSKKPLVMRLVRGDTVRLVADDQLLTLRVNTIRSSGEMLFAPIHEANVDGRNRNKEDSFSYISKSAGTLQKSQARRVTISPIGKLRDPGFKE